MNLLRASANRLSACGRALRPWLWQTLLPAAVLDPSGQASPAEGQPCRTAVARFTAARARGRARRRASSAAGAQIGNTGTFPGKPRRNGRACGRQYLRSAVCATRSVPRPDARPVRAGEVSGSHPRKFNFCSKPICVGRSASAAFRKGSLIHLPECWSVNRSSLRYRCRDTLRFWRSCPGCYC